MATTRSCTATASFGRFLRLNPSVAASSTFSNGEFTSRQSKWWVDLAHTLHKNFLMIGQPVVEEILSRQLRGVVHYGDQAEMLLERGGSVIITTRSGRRIQSLFAVGADGARSRIRQQIGASFKGTTPQMRWAVLDCFIATDFPTCPEIITFELNGQSRVSWIPRERGLSRFYVLLDGEVLQMKAEESIRKHLAPYKVEFRETEWFSIFNVKERVASCFVSRKGMGRVILAGDSAHVHSVNGGQGLNTGLADAFALAWRLAFIRRHGLKPSVAGMLLHSYDLERRKTAQGVVNVASVLVRDTVHKARQYVSTVERSAGFITGMGISYEQLQSPLILDSQHGIWTAGHPCPDLEINSFFDEAATRLYKETTYGRFLVLLIGEVDTDLSFGAVVLFFQIFSSRHRTSFVLRDDRSSQANRMHPVARMFWADWVNEDDAFIVVVRPDMYIGVVTSDTQICQTYLARF